MGAPPRGYFMVDLGATEVRLTIATPWFGATGTAEAVLYGADGTEVIRQPLKANGRAVLRGLVPPAHAGKPWSLAFIESAKGEIFRTIDLVLNEGCGRLLATHPSRLLVPINVGEETGAE